MIYTIRSESEIFSRPVSLKIGGVTKEFWFLSVIGENSLGQCEHIITFCLFYVFAGFVCFVNSPSESQGTATSRVVFISTSAKPKSHTTNFSDIDDNSVEIRDVNVRDLWRNDDDVYVFAKQGKSRHTGLWNLDSLIRSCENLEELDPKIQGDRDNYIIPSGVKDGLAGQVVVLHG